MENINLIFDFAGNRLTMQVLKSDKIDDVIQRFCTKAQVNRGDVKFYFDSREFNVSGKTIEQLNLQNFVTFTVVIDKTLKGA